MRAGGGSRLLAMGRCHLVATSVSGARAVILFVDDDVDALCRYQRYAGLHGYDAEVASAGHDALAIARLILPDAIVLDTGLADMDGSHVQDILREDAETQNIPILVVGEGLSPIDAAGHLEKPCSMEDVFRLLHITLLSRSVGTTLAEPHDSRIWD